MADLVEILNRIKDILSSELGNKKVYDKDVANALGINQTTLATIPPQKSRQFLLFFNSSNIMLLLVMFD